MNPPQQTLHSLLLLADAPSASKLTADDLNHWPDSLRRAVEASAILREEAPATWVNCDKCPDGGTAEVYYIKRSDGNHAYINCPVCGRVEIPLSRLKQHAVDPPSLAAWTTNRLGIATAPTELIQDRLWRLGTSTIGKEQVAAYLVRGIAWPDAERLIASRLSSAGGLWLTLNPSDSLPAWRPDGLAFVPLAHCLRLLKSRLVINKTELGHMYRSRRKAIRAPVTPRTFSPTPQATRTLTTLTHSDDFRTVSTGKREWHFTFLQSRIVEWLIGALQRRTPELSQSALLEDLDIKSTRLRDLFKTSAAWKTLIVQGEKKGTYRINPKFSR